jgi:hypothetical protein
MGNLLHMIDRLLWGVPRCFCPWRDPTGLYRIMYCRNCTVLFPCGGWPDRTGRFRCGYWLDCTGRVAIGSAGSILRTILGQIHQQLSNIAAIYFLCHSLGWGCLRCWKWLQAVLESPKEISFILLQWSLYICNDKATLAAPPSGRLGPIVSQICNTRTP